MPKENEYIKGLISNKNWVYGVVCYNKDPISIPTGWKYAENANVYVQAKNQYEAIAQAKLLVEGKEHYDIFSVQQI
ncbi:MAG: hypothetical protein PHE32_04220 [Candidatus Shapirobacteria bacterium]|jgi:hypothetical protein|nr:hypothetical protein [Candidatus Shapirobacteria bacterium]